MREYDKNGGKETRIEKKAKKRRRNIIFGAILAVLLVVVVLFLIFSSVEPPEKLKLSECITYTQILENSPELTEEEVALKVDNRAVGVDEWEFYFMLSARNYAQRKGVELGQYKDGASNKTLPDSVRAEAIKTVVINTAAISRAESWGIALTEEDAVRIDTEFSQLKEMYGENVFKMLGVSDEQTYKEFFAASLLENKVIEAAAKDTEKYLPEVKLEDYANGNSATMKSIEFVKGEDESVSGLAKAEIETIKARLDKGEKFEDLWAEVQIGKTGIAFQSSVYKDSEDTVKAVKDAVLSLKPGQISEIIETDGGYHILMRVVGGTEVRNYFLDNVEVAINKGITDESKIK